MSPEYSVSYLSISALRPRILAGRTDSQITHTFALAFASKPAVVPIGRRGN